jgi:transcriptional regulator with XRE-family HTH domain
MTSEKHRCCPPIYSKLCRLDCDAAKSIRLKKLSQEALAEPAGLHANRIGGIERGTTDPSLSTIAAIARGLKIKPGDLLKNVR